MRDVVTRFSGGGTYAGVINVAVQGLVDEAESAAEGEGSWWLIGCVIRSKTDGRFGGGRTAITADGVHPFRAAEQGLRLKFVQARG